MAKRDTNWLKIKEEYVTGNVTLSTLAEKYGVNLVRVAEHSSKEGWVEERENYRQEVYESNKKALIENAKQNSLMAQETLMSATALLIQKTSSVITEIEAEGKNKKNLEQHTRVLRNLTNALTTQCDLWRDIFEQPNLIARERIENEKAKNQILKDKEFVIDFGDAKEWSK